MRLVRCTPLITCKESNSECPTTEFEFEFEFIKRSSKIRTSINITTDNAVAVTIVCSIVVETAIDADSLFDVVQLFKTHVDYVERIKLSSVDNVLHRCVLQTSHNSFVHVTAC